jgi:hypothetical protein
MEFELKASYFQSRHSTTTCGTPLVHFALVILEMGVSRTICPSWLQILILLISASQVTKIIGANHWYLAINFFEYVNHNSKC